MNSVSVLYYLKSLFKNMHMFGVGAVIQAAGLVYEERFWPNVTSPHEAPNKEINPGFTPGSGETLFRLSPHTHMQKVCHTLFFFLSVIQRAPFEFTNDKLLLIPEAGLREEMIQSRPLLQTVLSSFPHKSAIFHNWHICSGTEMSDLPFVQVFFLEFCSVFYIIYNIYSVLFL